MLGSLSLRRQLRISIANRDVKSLGVRLALALIEVCGENAFLKMDELVVQYSNKVLHFMDEAGFVASCHLYLRLMYVLKKLMNIQESSCSHNQCIKAKGFQLRK